MANPAPRMMQIGKDEFERIIEQYPEVDIPGRGSSSLADRSQAEEALAAVREQADDWMLFRFYHSDPDSRGYQEYKFALSPDLGVSRPITIGEYYNAESYGSRQAFEEKYGPQPHPLSEELLARRHKTPDPIAVEVSELRYKLILTAYPLQIRDLSGVEITEHAAENAGFDLIAHYEGYLDEKYSRSIEAKADDWVHVSMLPEYGGGWIAVSPSLGVSRTIHTGDMDRGAPWADGYQIVTDVDLLSEEYLAKRSDPELEESAELSLG